MVNEKVIEALKNELTKGDEITLYDDKGESIDFVLDKDVLLEKITKFLCENFTEWQDTANKKYEFTKFVSKDSDLLVEYLIHEDSDPIATLVETPVSEDFITELDANFNPFNLYLLGLLESSSLDEVFENIPIYILEKNKPI